VFADTSGTWGVYVDGRAEAVSNGMPVLRLDGDWSRGYQPKSREQLAHAMVRAEVGAALPVPVSSQWFDGSWRVGALTRADASASLSGDAAQLVYHYRSKTDPALATQYDTSASTLNWKGRGVSVHAPALVWGSFRLDTRWDHLQLSRLHSTELRGQASYNEDSSYGFTMEVQDNNNKTSTPFLKRPTGLGQANSVSFAITWRDDQRHEDVRTISAWTPTVVGLAVDDAWSSLRWHGINANDALLNSSVESRTPDGYVEYQAVIQGKYTPKTISKHIPVNSTMVVGWERESGIWGLRLQSRLGLTQSWVTWQSASPVQVFLSAEPVRKALQIGLAWQGLSASLMADRLDNAAHLQGAQVMGILDF
jgi:hypothetical protein